MGRYDLSQPGFTIIVPDYQGFLADDPFRSGGRAIFHGLDLNQGGSGILDWDVNGGTFTLIAPSSTPVGVAVVLPLCGDYLDDDGDGTTDYPLDPGCASASADVESPRCQDGLDNDSDTGIDFDGGASLDLDGDGLVDARFNPATPPVGAADPQCTTASKDKEANACGFGFELAPVLCLLELGFRRARRKQAAP